MCYARIKWLGLETLEMQDLVFTYKVIFDLVSDSCNELFIMSNSSISIRGHDYKLFQRHSNLDSRKHFFAERNIKLRSGTVCQLLTTLQIALLFLNHLSRV